MEEGGGGGVAVTQNALVTGLAAWIPEAFAPGRGKSMELHPHVRIPAAGPVDLVSVRQEADRFAVGLWSILPGTAGDRSVDAMTRRLHAFEAWYSELLERAELQGFRPIHRLSITGNVVARGVRRSALVDLLSTRGPSICFWTWRRAAAGFEVVPFYGECPALSSSRPRLRELLSRLQWEDAAASAGRKARPKPIPT